MSWISAQKLLIVILDSIHLLMEESPTVFQMLVEILRHATKNREDGFAEVRDITPLNIKTILQIPPGAEKALNERFN